MTKKREEEICSYCGTYEGTIHNGVPECSRCWQWRKIDSVAANYWDKAIDHLFRNENGSGPDLNDFALWSSWGMRDEVESALMTLTAIGHAYHEMLENPRPWAKKA
jgi:hypothetical protein